MTQAVPPPMPPAPPAAPQPQVQPIYMYPPPPKRGGIRRFFRAILGLMFVGSILLNLFFLVALVSVGAMPMSTTTLVDGSIKEVVAVYPLTGLINEKTASDFGRFYQVVRDDKNIKAVVLRIDSGGGGVSASDQIHQLVRSIREDLKRPVVVSMGGVAASGGYYISAPATEIYAEHTTITGSIGVIAMWPVFKGLMDKWGIDPIVIRSKHAEEWKARENPLETPSPEVRKDVQAMLDTMQERFEKVVRDGRKGKLVEGKAAEAAMAEAAPTTKPSQGDPFNGKAYLADVALKLGLVDQIGYLNDAAMAAAKAANLNSPKVVRYTVRAGLLETLASGQSSTPAGSVRIDADTLDSITAPRIMMVWKP
jgi:protease-4